MATNIGTKTEPPHPPLARDAQGNLIAVPEGTTAWRVCRQTTGRPKEILGPDKKSMRFPLEMTAEELCDMCGADAYRLYALDELGKVLDYVVTVDVGRESRELRNAAFEAPLLPVLRSAAAAPTSDLRFALEAMAQMMRVNSEALRAVAESQADWVKSIASTRGFYRNAAPPPLPPEPIEEQEEEDDDGEPLPSKSIYDVLAPLAEHLAPSVKPIVSMLASGATAKALGSGSGETTASKPGFELRELVDLKYAAAKGEAKRAAAKPSLQARVMADPKLMTHFIAIKSLLGADESAQLLAVAEQFNEHEQFLLLEQISGLTPSPS